MSDLISRHDVIKEIHKYFCEEIEKTPRAIDEDGYEVYTDMPTVNSLLACNKELSQRIKALPSTDRPTGEWIEKDGIGWIPVSERLPKRGKDVLVTQKYYGKDDGNKDGIYVEISACYADGEEWHGYSDEYKMSPKNHKVIAWMPLPMPYKGGDSDG